MRYKNSEKTIGISKEVWEYLTIIKIEKGFKTIDKTLGYLFVLSTLNKMYLNFNDKQMNEFRKLIKGDEK